jgi:signal transduction histidine kinase
VGFEPSTASASTGLQNMADRIGALGGTLSVESLPGAGTRITGTVPASPN